jgi:hypothetical protein
VTIIGHVEHGHVTDGPSLRLRALRIAMPGSLKNNQKKASLED